MTYVAMNPNNDKYSLENEEEKKDDDDEKEMMEGKKRDGKICRTAWFWRMA